MENPIVTDADALVTEVPARSSSTNTPPNNVAPQLIEAELLVEEISIDGMCGVY